MVQSSTSPSGNTLSSIHFLLVEDDPSAAMIARMALEDGWGKRGITVTIETCSNGEEALQYLSRSTQIPDIIFTDLKMPKIDGKKFLTLLKNTSLLKFIPVIILTTSDDPEEIRQAFLAQCAGYILKTSNYAEFVASIEIVQRYWELSKRP